MAKGKRSKIKQKHKREFKERVAPAVAARIAGLNQKLMTAVGGPVTQTDVTMTNVTPAAPTPTPSAPVPLTTATLSTGGNKKLRSTARKVIKTVSSTSQKKDKKIKINLTAAKYKVKQ